jgi:phosphoribosylformylglycinamidine cyclo-ligase
MELYVPAELAPEIIRIANSFQVEAQIVGRVEASDEKKLSIFSEHGDFSYN